MLFRICYNECDEAEGAGEGMEKKLFFFDIDGTLTDRSTGQVVPSAKRALELLEEQGHFVSIATGRAHYKCRDLLEELGLENMVC